MSDRLRNSDFRPVGDNPSPCEYHGEDGCTRCCSVCGEYRCAIRACRVALRADYGDDDAAYDEAKDEGRAGRYASRHHLKDEDGW